MATGKKILDALITKSDSQLLERQLALHTLLTATAKSNVEDFGENIENFNAILTSENDQKKHGVTMIVVEAVVKLVFNSKNVKRRHVRCISARKNFLVWMQNFNEQPMQEEIALHIKTQYVETEKWQRPTDPNLKPFCYLMAWVETQMDIFEVQKKIEGLFEMAKPQPESKETMAKPQLESKETDAVMRAKIVDDAENGIKLTGIGKGVHKYRDLNRIL